MTPDVVVDIGNSRMKWGVCRDNRVIDVIRLPLDDEAAWEAAWKDLPPFRAFHRKWAVASVNRPALLRFIGFTYDRGGTVVFESHIELPIKLNVDEPGKVGLDRLFGAIAAKSMAPPETPVITVDVGTAVTVNLVDAEGVFQGGAIFPGPSLMAKSLHDYTKQLPLIDVTDIRALEDDSPAKNTQAAILLGITAALDAGISSTVVNFAMIDQDRHSWAFITGGGCPSLELVHQPGITSTQRVPALNLEGIRIAAEALP